MSTKITIEITDEQYELLVAYYEIKHSNLTIEQDAESWIKCKIAKANKLASEFDIDLSQGTVRLIEVAASKKENRVNNADQT